MSRVADALLADPYPHYRRLRAEDPVHYLPAVRGWSVLRYADVVACLKAPQLSNRIASTFFARLAPEQRARMVDFERTLSLWALFRDPPDHARVRSLITRAFTPRIVAGLAPRIEAIVTELLDEAEARGELDIIRDLATPLPVLVIADLLGVPAGDRDRVKQWSDDLASFLDSHRRSVDAAERAQGSFRALGELLAEVAEMRRRAPEEDLLSELVNPRDGAAPTLSGDELTAFGSSLLFAGHETTTNLIGNGALALLRHPDQRAQLVADPSLAEAAIEELLRYDGPVQSVWRVAREDLVVAGKTIRAGEFVFPVLGSANRDEAMCTEPDRLDLRRRDARHIAFGLGTHSCPGATLSRVEGRIGLRALFTRFPRLSLATATLEWTGHSSLRGLLSLPVDIGS